MILYLVIAVLFLITWVFNMSNFTGLMAFLIFLVLSFVAVKHLGSRVTRNVDGVRLLVFL